MSEKCENPQETEKVEVKKPAVSPGGMDEGVGVAELTRRLVAFRDERDWAQFHTVKNLMLSLALEAAELMEIAQWKTDGQVEQSLSDPETRARLEEECADVFLYLLLLCERAGIDLVAAAAAKIELNGRKYPADKARGTALKYDRLDK